MLALTVPNITVLNIFMRTLGSTHMITWLLFPSCLHSLPTYTVYLFNSLTCSLYSPNLPDQPAELVVTVLIANIVPVSGIPYPIFPPLSEITYSSLLWTRITANVLSAVFPVFCVSSVLMLLVLCAVCPVFCLSSSYVLCALRFAWPPCIVPSVLVLRALRSAYPACPLCGCFVPCIMRALRSACLRAARPACCVPCAPLLHALHADAACPARWCCMPCALVLRALLAGAACVPAVKHTQAAGAKGAICRSRTYSTATAGEVEV